MMDIVFVKTRYNYDSYVDFWKLVELSQFETCYVDEVDVRKPLVYIVTPINGEWEPHINNQIDKPHSAYLVHWCLERPSGYWVMERTSGLDGVGNFAKVNRDKIYERTLDDVWVSDKRLATESMLRFVVLGSHPDLGHPSEISYRHYDFVHMSYVSDRRARLYNQFDRRYIGPNCWPWDKAPNRDEVLKHSKFALNIHQDQYPFQEPLRWALFAAYGIPMLTEEVYDMWPWGDEVCISNPYDGMASKLRQMLADDYQRWYDMGMRARDMICNKYGFRKMVLKAVKECVG